MATKLAGLLCGGLALMALAAEARFPWAAGDEAPTVAGIKLGDERATVEKILGLAPETNKSNGALALLYPERGVVIVLDQDREAAVLFLKTRAAGDIGGVRVGDEREAVLARWGEPRLAQGAEAMYVAGNWAITLELGPDQRVLQISVGRAFGNTDLL